MENIEEKFIEATEKWYEFVGRDHHKDRDCHWYVGTEEQFSYGHTPKETESVVRHYGYVADDQEFRAKTREEVLLQAIDFIETFIREREKLSPTNQPLI